MNSNRPRIALIGYGYWGPNLLRNLFSSGQCDVVGVCDQSPKSREKCGSLYPQLELFDSVDKLLAKKPDGVIIATPPSTHTEIALKCLTAGSHVLIEKPMAPSVRECDQILKPLKKPANKSWLITPLFFIRQWSIFQN